MIEIKREQVKVEIETQCGEKFRIVTYGDSKSFVKYVKYCIENKKQIVICSSSTTTKLIFSHRELKDIRLTDL